MLCAIEAENYALKTAQKNKKKLKGSSDEKLKNKKVLEVIDCFRAENFYCIQVTRNPKHVQEPLER